MGLDRASVMFLCAAKSMGVDFDSTAMIGRQSFSPDLVTLRRVFRVLGVDRDAAEFLGHAFGEEFFAVLGASRIESLDVSHYENATILHDMNRPIPEELRERFSVVHDGGSIEHVFNVPQAFKNCMEMVRVGGHFTQVNIANNFSGHGFWQFSPELIFRMFTPGNGFELEAVLMHEVAPDGGWYVVSDPDQVHRRVELCNDSPTYILTIARRIGRVPIFAQTPQQSDYVSMWSESLNRNPQPLARVDANGSTWKRLIPPSVKRAIRSMQGRLSGSHGPAIRRGFDRPGYRRIREDDLLRGTLSVSQTG